MSRSIRTQAVGPEQVCFPLAAQAAQLLRQAEGRKDENVCLSTSAEPAKLEAQKWLELNRAGFGGIENGRHQRLDVSQNDDRCRIRHTCGMFVAGLLRRISNSIALALTPVFAAAGYSVIYLLGGGGLVGAIVIFFIAKMFGK